MSDAIRILVAEDHLVARVGVSTIVNMQPDMTVVAEASNGNQAVEMSAPISDVTLPTCACLAWERSGNGNPRRAPQRANDSVDNVWGRRAGGRWQRECRHT
jgi:hypothetical protein